MGWGDDNFIPSKLYTNRCERCGKNFVTVQQSDKLCKPCERAIQRERIEKHQREHEERLRLIERIGDERINEALNEYITQLREQGEPEWLIRQIQRGTKEWQCWILRRAGFLAEEDPEKLLIQPGNPWE